MRTVNLLLATCLLGAPLAALGEPTPVSVYVLSRDAKFVGDLNGGARVTLTDSVTGEVLAQGITTGSTGDTDRIMRNRKRHESPVTEDAAAFSATLELESPRRVTITAYGPLDHPASANGVSATQWLLPGGSDGVEWIVELPGLVVDVHDTATFAALGEEGETRVPVQATVRMMCGCPITPDGLWDANEFEIEARVLRDGVEFASTPLDYAGEASEFAGELLLTQPGTYRLSVRARQPRTGNAGVIERVLVVN